MSALDFSTEHDGQLKFWKVGQGYGFIRNLVRLSRFLLDRARLDVLLGAMGGTIVAC